MICSDVIKLNIELLQPGAYTSYVIRYQNINSSLPIINAKSYTNLDTRKYCFKLLSNTCIYTKRLPINLIKDIIITKKEYDTI